jgi:SAM-dependent methyltransferase
MHAVLRTQGLRGVGVGILAETVYRRLVLMALPLDEPIPEVRARLPVTIEPLSESEIDGYLRFRPDTARTEIERRFAAGCVCFIARLDGRIVHAGWAGFSTVWIEFLDYEMPLAPGDVYQFDSFTAVPFRGQGIAASRVATMARSLQRAGHRRLLAGVLPEVQVAFRPLERVGYRRLGRLGVLRVGPWRRAVWRPTRKSAPESSPAYWDRVLGEALAAASIEPWRAYMKRVYADLAHRWLGPASAGRGLKTDLFEEAVSAHALLSELGPGSVGLDCSLSIATTACGRLARVGGRYHFVVADLRQIPLRRESITRILAGSSLDHFRDKADIATSLEELATTLAPGGTLVMTLDNPHNPVVWLRNHLPFAALNRVGLVPYYVGETYTRAEGRKHLEALGLSVTAVTAVAHAPRAPAIWLAALAGRLGPAALSTWAERVLWGFEALARWPTRFRTGYYLAFRAGKRAEP